jgi:WD40 repeat protein
MNEAQIRSLLAETPIPAAEEAERRGLSMVDEAFAQRQPARRPVLPRLAVSFAVAALLAALMLSPAGAAVRDWIGDVFAAGVPDAEPGLTEIPGGGRLLVQSPSGPWVVQPDGSRRLLGRYGDATWSPRGLFVATVSEHALSAIEPDGTPRWSLSASGRVSDPRWSPSGFQIAYRAGSSLRVVAGDGTGDALLDPRVQSLPPAWSPQGLPLLAYVDLRGQLRIVDSNSGETLGSAAATPGVATLEWAADGSTLLEAAPAALRLRTVAVQKALASLDIGPPRPLRLPDDALLRAAALSPDGTTIAALLRFGSSGERPPRSEVALIERERVPARTLLSVPGPLSDLAWSPDGDRLLVSWRDADQWLFIPADGRGRVRAIDRIAAEFAPGRPGASSFPHIEGWCCRAVPDNPAG